MLKQHLCSLYSMDDKGCKKPLNLTIVDNVIHEKRLFLQCEIFASGFVMVVYNLLILKDYLKSRCMHMRIIFIARACTCNAGGEREREGEYGKGRGKRKK